MASKNIKAVVVRGDGFVEVAKPREFERLVEEVARIDEHIVNIEKAYIIRKGVRRSSDTLPKRFLKESVRMGPSAGHVIELSRMLDEYYSVRGWDPESGVPTEAKLRELGLQDVAEDLRKHGVNLK